MIEHQEIQRSSKSLTNNTEARPRHTNNTFLNKQGRTIRDQAKITEGTEELYTELYNSEQSTVFHNNPKQLPKIPSREGEAALRYMKNGTATGNAHINIDTLKAENIRSGRHVLSCTLNTH